MAWALGLQGVRSEEGTPRPCSTKPTAVPEMTLSTQHLRQLNQAILAVHSAPDVHALATHLLHALRLVVPGDIRVADFSGIAEIRAYTAYDPARSISAEVNAAVHRHLADNPLYRQRNSQATSISDLLTRQQWQRTSLYREAYARVDQQDGLALDVDLGHGGMLTLNVTRASRGYTAAERMALTLLGPHAQAQWRRLWQLQREQAAAQRLLSPTSCADDMLSPREREVLQWVASGCTNAQIAAMLDLRAGTVKRHLENIYRKLGAVDRRDAIARARLH